MLPWKHVPAIPNQEMIDAGRLHSNIFNKWQAMYKAAPKPPDPITRRRLLEFYANYKGKSPIRWYVSIYSNPDMEEVGPIACNYDGNRFNVEHKGKKGEFIFYSLFYAEGEGDPILFGFGEFNSLMILDGQTTAFSIHPSY